MVFSQFIEYVKYGNFPNFFLQNETSESKLNEGAIIHTTFGDIHIRLFPNECPKAVENFCTHSRRGYYNGHTFHRVIRSFMIQVCFCPFNINFF